MSSDLTTELALLNEIYLNDLDMKPTSACIKLKIKVLPLLEDENIDHHYEFDNPFLYISLDVPHTYPAEPPKFFLESTHSKVGIGSHLNDLGDRLKKVIKSLEGEPCILDCIEYCRVRSRV
jgi:hypothetical protein